MSDEQYTVGPKGSLLLWLIVISETRSGIILRSAIVDFASFQNEAILFLFLAAALAVAAPTDPATIVKPSGFHADILWSERTDCMSDTCADQNNCNQAPGSSGYLHGSVQGWTGTGSGCFDRTSGAHGVQIIVSNGGGSWSGINMSCEEFAATQDKSAKQWSVNMKSGSEDPACNALHGNNIKAVYHH